MNVRSFQPSKFRAQYEEEIRQRATWYYAPHALSEYKVPFLDLAQKLNVLSALETPREYSSDLADALFQASQPSLGDFAEPTAFRHYLTCLHTQVRAATRPTFDETVERYRTQLENARALLATLKKKGVSGQDRDFDAAIDAGLGAVTVLEATRGAVLRHEWPTLVRE